MKLNFILIPSNKPEKEVLSQLTDDLRRELKYASTERIEEYNQNFPDTKNQCVICGRNGEGYSLVVFDFNRNTQNKDRVTLNSTEQTNFNKFVSGIIKESFYLNENSPPLYIVQTGSLGYHVYFFVDTRNSDEEIESEILTNLKIDVINSQVQNISILAEQSVVFAEGCDFSNIQTTINPLIKAFGAKDPFTHVIPYTLIQGDKNDVPVISVDEFKEMVLRLKNYVLFTGNVAEAEVQNDPEILSSEEITCVNTLRARESFKQILRGNIIVETNNFWHLDSLARSRSVKRAIWLSFWKEIAAEPGYNANLQENLISILMRTQPDFDPAAARGIMTNILEQRSSPIRRGTYERYFEPWITPEEVQTGNPDSETNRLTWIPDIGDTIIRNYHVYYLSDTKSFVYYDGKTYVDDENFVGQLVLRALPEYGKPQTVTNQNHVLNYIKKFSYLKSKEFDADDTIMNFQNGIFDKKDRVLMPHDPDYLTLFISEYKYLPDCTQIPEITDRFLKSLEFSEDETRRLIYVLKALIEGDMSKMKFFVVFWGVTNSGKTKLAEKIGKLFGEPNERWKLIRLEKTGLQFGLQGLKNMNYVLIDDTGVDSLSSQSYSALKTLTSGSWCEGEDKYMPQSSFYVKFGVIITCNQLFKLPQSEEYSALVHRAKIFRFEKSHEKDEDFVNEFLENKEDNEQFLSYLLNLPKESLNNFHPLPDFEREEYGNAVTYWMQNASPINMLCATYIKRSEDTQVELNSLLYMLQTKARDSGININMTSKWARSKVEEFCLVNLGAIFLPPKKNSEGEYITWVRYIKADDVEIVPIVDNMPLENVIQESTPLTFQGLREEREREKEEDKESFTKADFTPLQKAVLRFIRKNDNPDTVIKVIDIKDGLRNEFPLQRDEIDSALMILEMSDEITMDRNGVIKINKKKEEKEGGMPK